MMGGKGANLIIISFLNTATWLPHNVEGQMCLFYVCMLECVYVTAATCDFSRQFCYDNEFSELEGLISYV